MRKKNTETEPTRGELEILQILWEQGPATVRQINEILGKKKDVQYTSTLKQMQVMAEKGLLKRNESQMTHVYSAVSREKEIKEHFLDRFLDLFYKGSPGNLIVQLLGKKGISKQDVAYIKEQLKKMDK